MAQIRYEKIMFVLVFFGGLIFGTIPKKIMLILKYKKNLKIMMKFKNYLLYI